MTLVVLFACRFNSLGTVVRLNVNVNQLVDGCCRRRSRFLAMPVAPFL